MTALDTPATAVLASEKHAAGPMLRALAHAVTGEPQEGARVETVEGRRPRSDKGKPRDRLVLSTSEIKTETACEQRYFFEYEQGRKPAADGGESAEWGLYIHRSLAQFYRALRHRWAVDLGLTLALRQVDRRGVDNGQRPYAPPADPYARAMLRAVIRGYVAYYGAADARDFDVLQVERRYELPALRPDGKPRRGFYVDGVIDIAWKLRQNGAVWITDHKTTRSDFEKTDQHGTRTYFLNAPINPQAIGYVDVAQRMGLAPVGFIFDMIKRPGLARVEKPERGESADDFEERMVGVIAANPTRYFARFPIAFEPWQIAKARENVIARGEEVLWRRRSGHWPQNDDACGKYDTTCPWMVVCTGNARPDDDRLFPLKKKG